MLEVANVSLPLESGEPGVKMTPFLKTAVGKHLGISKKHIMSPMLLRRSVDARKKNNVHFIASVAFAVDDPGLEAKLLQDGKAKAHVEYQPMETVPFPAGAPRPVVVGMGPAGLFCALYLAKAGAKPIVVERGANVEERAKAVEEFSNGGAFSTKTNVQFGEGGAGTFSDGKLTTNTKNPRISHVLHLFTGAGAPPEILWQAHPHIGSDKLPGVVSTLREEIRTLGGEVLFDTQLVDVEMDGGKVRSVTFRNVNTDEVRIQECAQLVLACGHSARDTFHLFRDKGFYMEQKPFSVGVRIEHKQSAINYSQWGRAAEHPALGAAEYKLVQHLKSGRSVYSFCMCPGGVVMCSASEEGGVVTNGMSYFARDGKNSNAALLVNVEPSDFGSDDVLAGTELQRSIEVAAYEVALANGGTPYQAPAQTVGSFLGKGASRPAVKPTYGRGVVWSDLRQVLPKFVCDALAEGIPLLDKKLAGFADDGAVMTAPETRSSSPVRILRGADLQAFCGVAGDKDAEGGTGVYPCGEGPGYAGGIMSAAVDGLRIAEEVCKQA